MGSAMTLGLVMGGLGAASSIAGANRESVQAKAQADAVRAQKRNAEIAGQVEAENIERQKIRMRREYEQTQSRNRSLLGAGNVDMTSGSAQAVAEGNASLFAQDIGENAYAKAMKEWETKANSAILESQAKNYDAQARSKASIIPTILNAAIAGAGGFASGYSMAGGSLAKLWGGSENVTAQAVPQAQAAQLAKAEGVPISQLTKAVNGGIVWGHPSGKAALVLKK